MKYYKIYNSDGDTYVTETTKEEILRGLDEEEYDCMDSIDDSDTNYWGEDHLIIKGEIVTPRKKEVVTKYDID